MLNYVRQYIKIRVVVFHTFISETKTVTPYFFAFLAQVTHYLTAVKILKNLSSGKLSHKCP